MILARKKDKVAVTRAHSPKSSSGESEHFAYIPELRFQEQYIFAYNVHVPLFVRYIGANMERITKEMGRKGRG